MRHAVKLTCPTCGCVPIKFLRVATVARALDTSDDTICRLIHSGELEAIRVGGTWRVVHESLDQWIKSQRSCPE